MMDGSVSLLRVTIDNQNICYTRSGNPRGDVILLVHGITTYSFIWRKILPYLEKDYDVIAIDLLGCGSSDMPLDVSYSIKAHEGRVFAFVKQLGIQQFHMVGHDLGGGIAQIFAINHPQMLKSLILINTVGYDFWPVQPIIAMRTPIIRQLLMGALDLGMMKLLVKTGMYHKELVDDALMDLIWKPLREQKGRKAFMHFARCLDHHDLMDIADQLKQLDVPTLIMRGDADPFLGAATAENLHADIPSSQLLRIDTASHYLMEDEPTWAAENILTFIRNEHV